MKHEVENAHCYAILADEVKGASKKELLGASLRYIHKGNVRERATVEARKPRHLPNRSAFK